MKNIILLVVFLNVINAKAQTIVNVEQLYNGKDSTITSLALSYSGARGNLYKNQFSVAPTLVLIRTKNDFKLFGGYNLLATANNNILNNGFAHIRHNYKITKRLRTFEFYQLQFNEVLLLNKREVAGAGLRYATTNKDSLNIDFGTGAMRELEVLNTSQLTAEEIATTRYYRASFVSSFNWISKHNISVHNVLYYQPRLTDFNDYRLLNDFSLIFTVNKLLKISATATTRYDSKPPIALNPFDYSAVFGINLVW